MNSENWVKIHTTGFVPQAYIIKDLLNENEILAVIVNKKDSSYNNFGNCEIFVSPTEASAASELIDEYFRIQ